MENYWLERAEKDLETAQQIEMFTRKGVAKALDVVIDDLNDYDSNAATPTKVCIETLEKLLDVLKSVERTSAYRRKDLEQTVAQAKDGEDNEQR